jgi:hypothetical protein|tara:strand:- start:307 stop:534 length:228 start_codon:yes stop_codon:yes gene_type:complete
LHLECYPSDSYRLASVLTIEKNALGQDWAQKICNHAQEQVLRQQDEQAEAIGQPAGSLEADQPMAATQQLLNMRK